MNNLSQSKNKGLKTQFHIVLDLPEGDNHLYLQKGKTRFMIKKAKDWKEVAQVLAKQEWRQEMLEGELFADVVFYLKRDRDIQGSTKLLFDSFQGIVYNNDNQFTHINLHKMVDKENPRVEITVEKI